MALNRPSHSRGFRWLVRAMAVMLGLAWLAAWYASSACAAPPVYRYAAGATLAFISIMGLRRIAPYVGNPWQPFKVAALRAAYVLAGLLFVKCIFTLGLAPLTAFETCRHARFSVAGALASLQPLQLEIGERAQKSGTLLGTGQQLALPTIKHLVGGNVSPDGKIFVTLAHPEATLVLTPVLRAGVLSWTCHGAPLAYMPLPCRGAP